MLIPYSALVWIVVIVKTYPVFSLTYALIGISHGAIYSLIGLGFATIYRIGRFINFAHGDVFMLGAVAGTWLGVRVLHAQRADPRGVLAVAAAVVFAMVVCAGVSVGTELLVFQRLRTATTLVPVVASVGVALILENVGIKWNGSGSRKFIPVVSHPRDIDSIWGVLLHVLASLSMSLPPLILAIVILSRTRWGRTLQAASDDPDAARLMGVDVNRTRVWAFGLAGACAGAAGVAYAQEYYQVSYTIGMQVGLISYAAAIIGGVGRTAGTVLGGLLIGVVEQLNYLKPAALGSNWSQTVIFSVMILVIVYRPLGLLGGSAPERV